MAMNQYSTVETDIDVSRICVVAVPCVHIARIPTVVQVQVAGIAVTLVITALGNTP
ncbi:hypothetical protein D3C73_1577690 [compost metagenome]